MKDLNDLKSALEIATEKNLIENFFVNIFYLDIDFHISSRVLRCGEQTQKILQLRDYIKRNYSFVSAVDYMPGLNRLRLYGNFESFK